MSELRDFIHSQPLFETHSHEKGFPEKESQFQNPTYRLFLGYAGADVFCAMGLDHDNSEVFDSDDGFFKYWDFVKTTGYGMATEKASQLVLNKAFSANKGKPVTDALKAYIGNRSAREVMDGLYDLANIQCAVADVLGHSPTHLDVFSGDDFPERFRFVLRFDSIVNLCAKTQMESLEKALDISIDSLDQLDRATDTYAEMARAKGKMVGFKTGLPYSRTPGFTNPSKADVEKAFTELMKDDATHARVLQDYQFHRLVQKAREFSMPLQIHTGYLAGNFCPLQNADPTGFIPIFQQYKDVAFDLFHASWPHSQLAGAIGKNFPNVWVDMCWAWAMSPVEMEQTLSEWLGAVPYNKIFAFGGDTNTPFAMVGYAWQARNGIANVLEKKLSDDVYDLDTCKQIAKRIMWDNPAGLYGIEG